MKLGTVQKKILFDFLPHIPGRIAKKIYSKYIGHSEFEIRRKVYFDSIEKCEIGKEYLSIVDVSFMLVMQKMTIK